MGVAPKFMTMSLGIPKLSHDWLESFSASMKKMCDKYNLSLMTVILQKQTVFLLPSLYLVFYLIKNLNI